MRKIIKNEKGQAVAPKSIYIDKNAFDKIDNTEIRWLGGAGIMINSRGTNIMIDPVLEGFDMDLLYENPIDVKDVVSLDGYLVTHIDNDHFSIPTCKDVLNVCQSYHAPNYVAERMKEEGISGIGHNIGDTFTINDIHITLTKVKHNWQNGSSKYNFREWKEEDYCGYWIETKDGTIWLPGDSKLLEEHLHMENPDVILFDFADNEWHITLDGAIKLANTYPNAKLICIHWGCVDAPNMTPFNGNPEDLLDRVINPDRIQVLAPGEPFQLKK
jgi:L-ascorbate metabolism protein UlaG (beta-lactamase superfamily)